MNVIPPFSPRAHIDSLCAKNGQNSDIHTKIAKAIEINKTSFTDKECVLNELLQNADDQLSTEGEVHFTLRGRELIFSHNGKSFDKTDVDKICDYANADHNVKGQDQGKTGYKDIGFKSVFTIARRVDILSNEWQFCFDESAPKWRKEPNENSFPWQIAPLWCEETDLSPEGKKALQEKGKTTFIFQLYEDVVIKEKLLKWIEHPQRLLFLKKIRTLIVTIGDKIYNLTCKNLEVRVNGQPVSRWKRLDFSVPLTPQMKTDINQLSPVECPKRLKGAESITLSFCLRQEEMQFKATQNSRLYCTLPTGVDAGLPFLVDAPFLLNPSREAVVVIPFNTFLIEQIATANFNFVRNQLRQNPSALNILVPSVLTKALSEGLRVAYQKCLDNLFQSTPFFPSYDGVSYLSIQQSVVDLTGFVRLMHEVQFKSAAFKPQVYPKLDVNELLRRFPQLNKSTLSWVINLLPAIVSQPPNVAICGKILTFFSTIFRMSESYKPEDFNLFKTCSFVFDTQMQLCSLNELSLPLESTKYTLPPEFLGKVIHPGLVTPEIKAFLKEIGLQTQTPQSIVETYSQQLDHPSLKKGAINKTVIRLFYSFFQDRLINDRILTKLRGIPLLNEAQQFIPSYQLYLSHPYQPAFPLEENPTGPLKQLLLSPSYLTPQDQPKQIKQFFSCLGVWEKCEVQFSNSVQIQTLLQIPYSFIDTYLNALFSDTNPAKPAKRGRKDIDTVSPFVWFPFIQFISYSPCLENAFWKEIEKQSPSILSRYCQETYHADHVPNGNKVQPFTYLQYLFTSQPIVRSSTQQFMHASALFAPSMYPIVGNTQPTAQIPVKLSPDMEKFLGFKTSLDVQACQTFLQLLKKSYKHDLYKYVMDELLQILRKADLHTIERIKKWEFQAANNEWKTASQLKAWAISHTHVPDTADWLKDVFNSKETEEFCALLNMTVVKEDVKINPFEHAEACPALQEFLLSRVPFMAYFWSKGRNFDKSPQEAVELFLLKLNEFECYTKMDEESTHKPFLKGNQLLVYNDWGVHRDRIGKRVAEYFGFKTGVEISDIVKSVVRDWSFRENSEEGKQFLRYKEMYSKLSQGGPLPTPAPATSTAIISSSKDEVLMLPLPIPSTTPFSPEKKREEASTPATVLNKSPQQENKTAWSPQTPPQQVTTTPSKALTPKPDWQPTVRANAMGSQLRTKREATEQVGGLSDLAKKKIGLWAEEHIVTRLVEKYKRIFDVSQVQIDQGTRTIVDKTGKRTCTIVWYNDPAMRPADKKDDELWDSGEHYDIDLIYKEEGRPARKRMYEVKGTTGSSVHFFLSTLEWQTYLSSQTTYRIRVVTAVGTDNAQVNRIKDLLESLRVKSLLPISNTEFKG